MVRSGMQWGQNPRMVSRHGQLRVALLLAGDLLTTAAALGIAFGGATAAMFYDRLDG
jgi:hypothetical protein